MGKANLDEVDVGTLEVQMFLSMYIGCP